MTERAEEIAKFLDISIEEAKQIIADDNAIDKGEKLFEQTEEQKKNTKKATAIGTKKTVYNFKQRQRKEDNEKRELINAIYELLGTYPTNNLTMSNPEREINFTYKDRKFKIVLSAPRS